MAPLPVEILLGVYLGVLTGIIPGLIAWVLGFVVKYITGVTLPGFGVVALGVTLAGANGGLLLLADPTITQSTNAPVVITALLVVVMIALYAHNRGDKLGESLPRRLTLRGLRERTLSADVVQLVGGRGEVRIRTAGEVTDMEGYPPLPEDLRATLREGEWTLPADLPLSELESRLAERLRTDHDLADISVSIDERGRATIAAAPPMSALSKRIPPSKRAVSVETLVPTGLARGDEVTIRTPETAIRGTVVSARSDGTRESTSKPRPGTANPVGGTTDAGAGPDAEPPPVVAPTTTGGDGRLTVAVARADAEPLLRADRVEVTVEAQGTRREFELVSLLRRAGKRFRKVSVRAGGGLDGVTLGEASVRGAYGVAVLAVRRQTGWVLAPGGATELAPGDELFAVGTRDDLARFEEAIA